MRELTQLQQAIQAAFPQTQLRFEEPLARHTSFKIGGPCEVMAFPCGIQELSDLLRWAHSHEVQPAILGAGTNVLAADAGRRGLVICTRGCLDGMTQVDDTHIRVLAGVSMARAANFAAGLGLSGLEFAHGIPGTVGGAVTMNAGAYGGEMKDVVVSTRVLNADGTVEEVRGEAQDFSYRHSAFSDEKRLILSAEYTLKLGDPAAIQAQMDELAQRRRFKQPLDVPSAGSTFKRPEGYYAAALIDECGLKGKKVGGAQVSIRHAGFVVNQGGATCADVLALVELVRETVLREAGVALELEVRTLGV